MTFVFIQNGKRYQLVAAPIAQGGQGAIHRFDPNAHPNLRLRVAKLYLDPQKAAADEGRIKHLCANAPGTSRLSNPDCLVWPEEPLFDAAGKFIGYIMPLVKGGKDLEIMCDVVGPQDPAFVHFGGCGGKERNARCQVAANMLDALVALEAAGEFVLTDLKPPNIQVAPTGLAYLIDLDSVQVASKGQVLFNGMGYTDEYPPPEFYQSPDAQWVCSKKLRTILNGGNPLSIVAQHPSLHGQQSGQRPDGCNPARVFCQWTSSAQVPSSAASSR